MVPCWREGARILVGFLALSVRPVTEKRASGGQYSALGVAFFSLNGWHRAESHQFMGASDRITALWQQLSRIEGPKYFVALFALNTVLFKKNNYL